MVQIIVRVQALGCLHSEGRIYLTPLFGCVTEGWFCFGPDHPALLGKAHLEVSEGKVFFWESSSSRLSFDQTLGNHLLFSQALPCYYRGQVCLWISYESLSFILEPQIKDLDTLKVGC